MLGETRSGIRFCCISDTHFGHDKLVKEGLRKENFEDDILEDIENSVRPGDVLIHLGDVSFYDHPRWHKMFTGLCRLIGCKCWLILGNHDKKSNSWYMNQGWDFIGNAIELKLYGLELYLSHKPVLEHTIHSSDMFDYNIHGHIHDGRLACPNTQNILVTHKVVNLKQLVGK